MRTEGFFRLRNGEGNLIKYILLISCLLFIGCVSIKVEHPDGTKYTYKRWGKQSLADIEYSRDADGAKFKIGATEGDTDANGMIRSAVEGAVKGMR